ncbi:MAG TPA: ferritin family protein, partial [Anaeromyxobacteraceae bacterium]|nr:ferritin family protein [Anaeromyxobacteraceae bacterium]
DVNAQARYAAFAEAAEREGYLQAARLFRAAARSEQIRAAAHARALRLLGESPAAEVEPFQPRGTRQNLLATLAHEGPERLRDYPRFAQQARRDGVSEAVLGFILAHGAEEGLARLYQDAMRRLSAMRDPGDDLYVCPVCGHVVKGPPPAVCPVSLSPGEAFEPVG